MKKIKSWRFQGNERNYLTEVLNSGFKAGADGAFTTKLEKLFSEKYNQEYAIAFNSGTTTLHSILLAIGCTSKDEVLVPSLTPLMCGLAIHYTGATPVYVDVDENTFLIDPIDLESKITKKTKAIMAVHMYGAVCDMKEIMRISKKYKIPVVEDCAQCHLGKGFDGKYAGTYGVAGSWSFENSKQLTCGDGGIVTTDSPKVATSVRKIGGLGFKTLTAKAGRVRTDRDKLQNPNWERFDTIGFNFRMNQMAAAVALAQVERQEDFINLRRLSGIKYTEALKGSKLLRPQQIINGNFNTFYTFSAKFETGNGKVTWYEFRKKYMELGGDGIYAASKLLYQEPIFKKLKIGRGKTPNAEKIQKQLMNFTTNQSSVKEIEKQCEILLKTRKYFNDLS
jgi:perosamine synthetase